jgi:hypothetical protein
VNAANALLHRFYWTGRRDYRLPAGQAIEYARNRFALWAGTVHWSVEHDDDHHDPDFGPFRVVIFDDDGTVLDSLGGIDETDENDPYVVQLAFELAAGIDTESAAA